MFSSIREPCSSSQQSGTHCAAGVPSLHATLSCCASEGSVLAAASHIATTGSKFWLSLPNAVWHSAQNGRNSAAQPALQVRGYPLLQSSDGSSQHSRSMSPVRHDTSSESHEASADCARRCSFSPSHACGSVSQLTTVGLMILTFSSAASGAPPSVCARRPRCSALCCVSSLTEAASSSFRPCSARSCACSGSTSLLISSSISVRPTEPSSSSRREAAAAAALPRSALSSTRVSRSRSASVMWEIAAAMARGLSLLGAIFILLTLSLWQPTVSQPLFPQISFSENRCLRQDNGMNVY